MKVYKLKTGSTPAPETVTITIFLPGGTVHRVIATKGPEWPIKAVDGQEIEKPRLLGAVPGSQTRD